MKKKSTYPRETLKQYDAVLIKLVRNGNEAIVMVDGKFELFAMNHYYAGWTLLIDGVGYEFCKTISNNEAFKLLKEEA